MTRRKRTSEEKAKIVLESLTTLVGVAEQCRQHQVDPALFYKWREAFLAGEKRALENGLIPREKALERKNEELKQLVAEFTLANGASKNIHARMER